MGPEHIHERILCKSGYPHPIDAQGIQKWVTAGMATLAERVRRGREAMGWTQDQLVEAAGVSQSSVSRIESGETPDPREATLRKIAAALKTTSAQLRGDGPAPAPRTVVYDAAPLVAPDERDSPIEAAMLEAFDKTRHNFDDVTGVRRVFRETMQHQRLDGDLVGAARTYLDAAAHLRRNDIPVTAASMMPLVTVGIKATPQQHAAARGKSLNSTYRSLRNRFEREARYGQRGQQWSAFPANPERVSDAIALVKRLAQDAEREHRAWVDARPSRQVPLFAA